MKKSLAILVLFSGNAFVSAMKYIRNLSEYEIRRRYQHGRAMREHHAAGQHLTISADLDVELEKIKQEDKLSKKQKEAQEDKDNSNFPLARY